MATMQDFQNQRLKAYYEAEHRRAIDDLIAGGAVLEGFETKKKMSKRVVFMQ